MHTQQHRRRSMAAALLCAATLLVGAAGPAAASDIYNFGAGVACDFALDVDGYQARDQNSQVFTDRNGNIVAILVAGRGSALTFTNVASGKTLSLMATGASNRYVLHPDGSFTLIMTGMNVLFMFPTDVPAGPSTTLYIGRVVADFDAAFNTTLKTTAGAAMDICAALTD